MQILSLIRQRFAEALDGWVANPQEHLQRITLARDPQHGDYQANVAMPLKQELGKPPQQIAAELVSRLRLDDLCHPPEVAGPGFINLRLRSDFLNRQLELMASDSRLGITPCAVPRTYVIDYSAPNVAKPMHVGHIRTTVIGDALAKILRFLGHRVITDNHLGDWGTQFGMIIYGYKHFVDAEAYERDAVAELGRLYRLVQQIIGYQETLCKLPPAEKKLADAQRKLASAKAVSGVPEPQQKKDIAAAQKAVRAAQEQLEELQGKVQFVQDSPALLAVSAAHPNLEKRCQLETVRLHEGDEQNLALWNQFLPISLREIETVYHRLGIEFDYTLGESFYHPLLGDLVEQFLSRGLATISEGATCVFLDGFDAPMIIRKSDGAYLYATTDLATIQYRMQQFRPDVILYVVDMRQSEHFAKLFAAARKMGYNKVQLQHVSFGTVLGPDGKPFKTRSGSVVGLEHLLDEAVERAFQAVCTPERLQKAGLDMPLDEQRHIANVVGLGAIKYADLSHNRTSDYEFNTEKMVALDGNTATYVQYMYARTQSILRRAEAQGYSLMAVPDSIVVQHPAERTLALQLLQLEDVLHQVVAEYYPHLLTGYLYELAKQFASFFEQCPVLTADDHAQRQSRLRICQVTGRVLEHGLGLLGIGVVPRM
ncbi:MAG: arginine--tRNA ligase [Pirellulaceae bacterium]|nr:arginine--tRNA ligase [Pirellulaceae bacterium]